MLLILPLRYYCSGHYCPLSILDLIYQLYVPKKERRLTCKIEHESLADFRFILERPETLSYAV